MIPPKIFRIPSSPYALRKTAQKTLSRHQTASPKAFQLTSRTRLLFTPCSCITGNDKQAAALPGCSLALHCLRGHRESYSRFSLRDSHRCGNLFFCHGCRKLAQRARRLAKTSGKGPGKDSRESAREARGKSST